MTTKNPQGLPSEQEVRSLVERIVDGVVAAAEMPVEALPPPSPDTAVGSNRGRS